VEKKTSSTNKTNSEELTQIIVSKDGSGHFTKVQDAINATKAFPYERIVIYIKNGVYYEKVKIYEWNTMLSLIGEDKEKTIITYNDYFDKINLGRNSTFHTPTVLIEADNFIAKNITFENNSGNVGQAIALSVVANRVKIENCNIIANQDALYLSGSNAKHFFKNCHIEGTTDFIFGQATAYFEDCAIHSKANSYITAASTPKDTEFGFVFKNCRLTAHPGVTEVYLGRPWRVFAKTVFIDCHMGNHIKPEGWHDWNKPDARINTFYAEYGSMGPGANNSMRATWAKSLNKKELKTYTKENILGKIKWYETSE
jgi:pectinesterase